MNTLLIRKTKTAVPKDAGLILSHGGRFSGGGNKQKGLFVELSADVNNPQVDEINLEPSSAAGLMVHVWLRCVKTPDF